MAPTSKIMPTNHDEPRSETIGDELVTAGPMSRERRIELLRELCRSDEEVPDEMLDHAMAKLLERLGE